MRWFTVTLVGVVLVFGSVGRVPAATSTFDVGSEEWTVVDLQESGPYDGIIGGPWAPNYSSTGGNPAGHISFDDPTSQTFYFEAPNGFLGNHLEAYGTFLTYDQLSTPLSNYHDEPDVVLSGAGLTLVFQNEDPPGIDWTAFSVPLVETEWRKGDLNGPSPSEAEFRTVLASLSALRISGEYSTPVMETTALDNARLIPEPSTLMLLVGGALAFLAYAWGRRRVAGG